MLIDRNEAASILGVSERQLQNYAKDGKISVQYVPGKTGKVSRYSREEIEALKDDLSRPVHRGAIAPEEVREGGTKDAREPSPPSLHAFSGVPLEQMVERLIEAFTPSPPPPLPPSELLAKPILSLQEASRLSGLSKGHLREAIASGALPARRIGRGWKMRTKDLIAYAEGLFPV